MQLSVAKDHKSVPEASSAYMLKSVDPIYTDPSAPMAGDEYTAAPVRNDHKAAPVLPSRAYT